MSISPLPERKLRIILPLLLLACTFIAAQAQYRVTATIISPDNEPEEYCTYRIFAPGDSVRPILGNVADENGYINVTLPAAGTYTLGVSAPLRQPLSVQFSVSPAQPVAELGYLNTAYAGEQLNEVTITAQRPLVTKEIDRIGYEVAADPDASTSNLREIMRKVPLVTVEDDGTIKVNGSSDFKIYKNGRPNNAFTKNAKDIFAAIPASTIRKIEVITDPGAREDAESSGVILNIVTTSTINTAGVTGNIGMNWDTNSPLPQLNAFIMTQVNKLTLSANGGFYKYGKRNAEGIQHSTTHYRSTGDELTSDSRYTGGGKGGWFNVEGSLELDTLNLLTTALNGYVGRNAYDMTTSSLMSTAAGTPLYSYHSYSYYPKNGYTDIDFNIDYQRSTRLPGETITLSYRLSHTNQDMVQNNTYTDMVNTPFSYTGINSDFDLKFYEHTFQVDWSRPLGKIFKLDTGAKYILRLNHSDNHQELIGTTATTHDEFEHRYHILGLYADARAAINKVTARAGLRYEYSRLSADFIHGQGEDFHSTLNDLVPNISLGWTPAQASMFKLSYSRRIQRPGIIYLNPAVTESPTAVSYGNPDLESTAINNASLGYTLIKRKFNLDLTATFIASNNGTGTLQWVTPQNITYSTYDNLQHQRAVQLSAFFQWAITPKTSWMVNAMGGWRRYSIHTPTENTSLARWNGNFYTRVSQALPWDLNLSLSANYWSGYVNDQYSYATIPASGINYSLQLKKSFLKERTLDVSITAQNIALKDRTAKQYNINSGATTITSMQQYHRSSIALGVSWRFGKLRAQVKKAANTIKNDDLDGRKK